MKILYLTKGDHVDYQNDCLLIGLKELYGADIVDLNKQSHNYVTYDEAAAKKLYGMGMTVTRILPDLEVDRTDITSKIKNKYFDYIVYGSIWRCSDYIDNILQYYPPHKIIAVDGEDHTHIHNFSGKGIMYFKRELVHSLSETLKPIAFAFPTDKTNFNTSKQKDFAYITPLNRKTYIYTSETDYYNDYNQSRFGVTLKKAGWDCLRHYEILGNGCIPYFLNIHNCPANTMFNFPKELCKKVIESISPKTRAIIEATIETTVEATVAYDDLIEQFREHFLTNNTTKSLANYFVNTITQS